MNITDTVGMAIIFYLIVVLLSISPVIILFSFGPELTPIRLIYGVIGISSAGLIGLFLYLISIDHFFYNPNTYGVRVLKAGFAGFVEEIFRYPAILLAQFLGLKYYNWSLGDQTPSLDKSKDSLVELEIVDNKFTKITDPHGMGMFFGISYGFYETIAFYIYPRIEFIIQNENNFDFQFEFISLIFAITGVMAHTSLTYLAMAIIENSFFWKITISSHIIVNSINVIFDFFAPNSAADQVVGIFTRFSLLLIAYFFLKPRIRYQSPAVLFYLLVILFLLIILISTFIFLLVGFITEELYNLF